MTLFALQQGLAPDAPPTTSTTQQSTGPVGGGAPPAGPSSSMMMVLMLAMVGFMFFMNSRRQKKEQQVRASLKKGDRVVGQSGLIGELVEMDEKVAKVKVAPGVQVQMLVAGLSRFEQAPAKVEGDLKELKESKATAEKK